MSIFTDSILGLLQNKNPVENGGQANKQVENQGGVQAIVQALLSNNQNQQQGDQAVTQSNQGVQSPTPTPLNSAERGYTPKIEVGENFIDKYYKAKSAAAKQNNENLQGITGAIGKFFGGMIGG